ncbi:EC1 protein [Colletotrichum higginsianum]|nr:EC1 protein [Colletotrichum higginsianum]
MKSILPAIALAAAVAAASPQILAEITRDLRHRAVYPEKGQVCCRTDGKNCVSSLAYSIKETFNALEHGTAD